MNTKNMETLGAYAERLVRYYFESQGSKVQKSSDLYDDKKDILIDGASTEIKFQTIYYNFKSYDRNNTYMAFTVPIITGDSNKVAQNQLMKCVNVDRWIIVQNPKKSHERTIKIWEAPPLGQRKFKIIRNSKDGRITAGFPLSDFKLLTEIDNKPIFDKIKKLEFSQYGGYSKQNV